MTIFPGVGHEQCKIAVSIGGCEENQAYAKGSASRGGWTRCAGRRVAPVRSIVRAGQVARSPRAMVNCIRAPPADALAPPRIGSRSGPVPDARSRRRTSTMGFRIQVLKMGECEVAGPEVFRMSR